jgi:hypothetical protein
LTMTSFCLSPTTTKKLRFFSYEMLVSCRYLWVVMCVPVHHSESKPVSGSHYGCVSCMLVSISCAGTYMAFLGILEAPQVCPPPLTQLAQLQWRRPERDQAVVAKVLRFDSSMEVYIFGFDGSRARPCKSSGRGQARIRDARNFFCHRLRASANLRRRRLPYRIILHNLAFILLTKPSTITQR